MHRCASVCQARLRKLLFLFLFAASCRPWTMPVLKVTPQVISLPPRFTPPLYRSTVSEDTA